jgi:hypothetical protein
MAEGRLSMKASVSVKARRVIPNARRKSAKRTVTLGELIAAAYDAVGDPTGVAQLLGSQPMRRATGRRFVVV